MKQQTKSILPKGWAATFLSEIAETASGGTPSRRRQDFFGGSIPWVKSGELNDATLHTTEEFLTDLGFQSSSAKMFPAGTLCIALYGATVGKLAILGSEAATNQAVCGIFLSPIVDIKYLFYVLLAQRSNLIELGKGGAQPNISQEIVRRIVLPLPPFEEQARIASKVDELMTKLDAGVAELLKAQAQLKRYRQAVLKAAVTGELTREWREAHKDELEPASELLARILKERRAAWEAKQDARMKHQRKPKNEELKNSYREPVKPQAEAPESFPLGWAWVTWDQIGFSQNGRLFPSNQYQSTGVKLLRPGNLHISGKVVWTSSNTRYMPRHCEEEFSDFIVQGQELVINLTAQSLRDEFLGRVCLTDSLERCLLNQRIARLMPIKVSPKYLLYLFKSEIFRRFVNTLNTGSLIQHMFTSQLSEFCFPLPSLEEQEQIVAEAERCLSIADSIEQSLDRGLVQADQMRAAILKQAFDGKLVPQDPNDEPAELLLERIKLERAKREAEKQAEAKSNRKRSPKKRPQRTERPAA